MRAAAVLAWTPALGFGLPCIYATRYFADHGEVWTFLGFPTYGEGPFTDIGIETTIGLLAAFLVVCAAELMVGRMLWRGRRAGIISALALLPIELAFWIGFGLPVGAVAGVARTAVIIALLRARGGTAAARRHTSRST